MIEVKINITGLNPIAEAIAMLASVIAIGKDPDYPGPTIEPKSVTAPEVQGTQATNPTVTTPQAPATTPAAVPTSTRTYTVDELSVAGAQLMQTVGMPKLTELINSFGVASLMELPKERYNEFAARLREMGAQL